MKKPPLLISFSLFILLVLTGFLSKADISQPQIQVQVERVAAAEQSSTPVSEIKPVTPPPPVVPTPAPKPVTTKPKAKPKAVPPKPTPQPVATPLPPPAVNCNAGSFNSQFLCLINQYRASKNLNALSYDAGLNATAVDHSTWMNANQTLSHEGENGSKFFERCQQHNVKCDAENVAMGYTTAQKLFNAWKASAGHNANMLGSHTKMGLGLVGKYATQLFK